MSYAIKTMELNITEPYLERKLSETLGNGVSVDEFIKIGLDALEVEKQKEERFVAAINKGIEDIEAGRSRSFDRESLKDFFDEVVSESVSKV